MVCEREKGTPLYIGFSSGFLDNFIKGLRVQKNVHWIQTRYVGTA